MDIVPAEVLSKYSNPNNIIPAYNQRMLSVSGIDLKDTFSLTPNIIEGLSNSDIPPIPGVLTTIPNTKPISISGVLPTTIPGVYSIPLDLSHSSSSQISIPTITSANRINIENAIPTTAPGIFIVPSELSKISGVFPSTIPGVYTLPGKMPSINGGSSITITGALPTMIEGVFIIPDRISSVEGVFPTDIKGIFTLPGILQYSNGAVYTTIHNAIPTTMPGVFIIPENIKEKIPATPGNSIPIPLIHGKPGSSNIPGTLPITPGGLQIEPGSNISKIINNFPNSLPKNIITDAFTTNETTTTQINISNALNNWNIFGSIDLSFTQILLNVLILFTFLFVVYLIVSNLGTNLALTVLGLLVHFIFCYISFFPI